jgi:hypothetical protein
MMSLPASLTDRVEEAHRALFRHPEGALLPWYRYAIYAALADHDLLLAGRARAWLDIPAVRHVQFCWQPAAYSPWSPAWPGPMQLLILAEQLLSSAAKWAGASTQLNRAHAIADIVGVEATAPHYPGWCVYEAALRALGSALSAAQPPTSDAPSPLASCADDASGYAAIAVAGGTWRQAGDGSGRWDWQTDEAQLRRAVFWEWWLREGVPSAWGKA